MLPVGWDLLWPTRTTKQFYRYLSKTKNFKWVTWRDHIHFRDVLSCVGWDLLCSTYTSNFKCLRLNATKKWKAEPNVKFFVLSPPLGHLRVPHMMHLWLDSDHWILSLSITAVALLSEICQNTCFVGRGTLSANLGRRECRLQSLYKPLNRQMI